MFLKVDVIIITLLILTKFQLHFSFDSLQYCFIYDTILKC